MEFIKPKGFIEARIKYRNTNEIKILKFNNQTLNSGKEFLCNCLLEKSPLFISNMLFGDGGTDKGEPKEIQAFQENLNGVVRIKKQVIAQIDPEVSTQAVFTIIIGENECNGITLNEMALELSNEKLFSLSTFADLNKTDDMEITWSWFVCFV